MTFRVRRWDGRFQIGRMSRERGSRPEDLVGRFGGEEFALVLPDSTTADAAEMCNRLRVELAGRLASADVPTFTASFGIADSRCSDRLDDVVRAADDALYAAKRAGRDRVVEADGALTASRPASDLPVRSSTFTAGFAAIGAHDDPLDP